MAGSITAESLWQNLKTQKPTRRRRLQFHRFHFREIAPYIYSTFSPVVGFNQKRPQKGHNALWNPIVPVTHGLVGQDFVRNNVSHAHLFPALCQQLPCKFCWSCRRICRVEFSMKYSTSHRNIGEVFHLFCWFFFVAKGVFFGMFSSRGMFHANDSSYFSNDTCEKTKSKTITSNHDILWCSLCIRATTKVNNNNNKNIRSVGLGRRTDICMARMCCPRGIFSSDVTKKRVPSRNDALDDMSKLFA